MLGDTNTQSRKVYTLIITLLLCGSLVVGSGVVAANSSNLFVTVSDVTVSDKEPNTGDRITVTPAIRHSSSSDGGFRVTEVTLTTSSGEQISHVDELGVIAADESIEVPLQATFDTAGEKRLTVNVRGVKTSDSGAIDKIDSIEYPVYVSVSEPSAAAPEPKPQLHIDTGTAVSGSSVPVDVTVSNGGDNDLSSLSVQLSAIDRSLETETRIKPTLSAGNMTTFSFEIQPDEVGDLTLQAELDSENENINTTRTVSVQELRPEIVVDATIITKNDSRYLQYRVTNVGNTPVNDVSIIGESGGTQLPAAGIGTVDVASSQAAMVPTNTQPEASVTIKSTYSIGDKTNQYTRTIDSVSAVTAQDATDNGIMTAQQFSLGGGGGGSGSPIGTVISLFLVGVLGTVGYFGYRRFQDSN